MLILIFQILLILSVQNLNMTHLGSGGYWVRRMRQLPRAPFFSGLLSIFGAPLENSTYSFVSLQMFFRDHDVVGTKSGK